MDGTNNKNAHDFNNQLSVIVTQAELLKLADNPEVRNTRIAHILTASKRAYDLTRQLLTFARKTPVRNEPIDTNQIVQETAEIVG